MSWISDPQAWTALAALTVIEVVLGIDNIIFILISVGRLPERQRAGARILGLLFALATRIGLLFTLTWFMGLTQPLIRLPVVELSLRDLILIGGGLFLLAKSTFDIHGELEIEQSTAKHAAVAGLLGVVLQIAVIDIVFSLDSVITAIGLAERVEMQRSAVQIDVASVGGVTEHRDLGAIVFEQLARERRSRTVRAVQHELQTGEPIVGENRL